MSLVDCRSWTLAQGTTLRPDSLLSTQPTNLSSPCFPTSPEGNQEGNQDKLQIEPKTPLRHIEEVIAELLRTGRLAVGIDLRKSRETGPDHMTTVVTRDFLPKLLDQFRPLRPGPNKTHVAPEDIPELRKLIHGRSPQQSSDPSDAGVAHSCRNRSPFPVRVRDHGTELQSYEFPPSSAHPALAVEDWTPIFQLYGQSD